MLETSARPISDPSPSSNQAIWPVSTSLRYHASSETLLLTISKGKSRVIPLNAEARAVALHQLSDATIRHFVFPSSKTKGQIKEVKKGLAGDCKQAGILYDQTVLGGITFHTFRH